MNTPQIDCITSVSQSMYKKHRNVNNDDDRSANLVKKIEGI